MVIEKNTLSRPVQIGIAAVFIVLSINLLVLSLLDFPEMAILQIKQYWLLLLVLISGFGFQIGLYSYLKTKEKVCSATAMGSGGISSVSMILCCSHYLAAVLPFLSVTFAFLTKYTPYILLIGILSNMLGSLFLLKKADTGQSDKITWWNNVVVIFLIILFVSSAFAVYTFRENNDPDKKMVEPEKCKPQQGYTEEQWIEHMGHHPSQYKECLGGT